MDHDRTLREKGQEDESVYMCVFISSRMYNTTKKLFVLFVLTQTRKRSNAISPFWELCYAERFRRLGREGKKEGKMSGIYIYILKFRFHKRL